mmetsp:Transcript_5649/g.8588  ORF Transcript_5649/g.8588 Transcript_5649/m.8588 type:complete len:97 (+) Transcript_5649:96-386(+)
MMFSAGRILSRSKVACRHMGGTAKIRTGKFQEKTFKQIWLSDEGAYPVMGICIAMAIFVPSYGIYFMTSSPDVRLFGDSRKHFLRGELATEYTRPE